MQETCVPRTDAEYISSIAISSEVDYGIDSSGALVVLPVQGALLGACLRCQAPSSLAYQSVEREKHYAE